MKNFIHTILAFVVVAVIMSQTIAKFVIVIDYQVNKEFITKTLCENKAKPTMHCNGKCHLKKQLEKQEKKEKPVNTSKEKFEIQFLSDKTVELDVESVFFEERTFVSFYNNDLAFNDLRSIFQPPQG